MTNIRIITTIMNEYYYENEKNDNIDDDDINDNNDNLDDDQ